MKTISYKGSKVDVKELVSVIQSKLTLVEGYTPSQYLNIEIEDENDNYEIFKIRVSNHSAKRTNNSNNLKTLSFVTNTCDQGMLKMNFNEYIMEDIEDMYTNETNMSGWVTVADILTDFIEDYKFED